MRHEEILGLLPYLKYGADHSPGMWSFLLELLFWAIVFLLTLVLLRYRPALLEKAELRLHAISQRTGLWVLTFGLAVLVIRLGLLVQIPVPIPVVHDEFSYLLGSDTFAHGRVTNPANPMGIHFETFHVNLEPTYQSMYPPGQSLALAIGQKLTGEPWIGVVLSTAFMCGAIYWMLLAWLPPSWAWLGGAFAVVRYGIFSYWINTYFGGSVAAIGGTLVLGAWPRFRRNPKATTALIFAAGLLIMANSRPLEGFLFSLPIVLASLVYMVKSCTDWKAMARRLLPAVVLLIAGAGGMLYYNLRGTGHALLMPYALNYRTYHISRPFFFQKPNPVPEYNHQTMRVFYVYHELPDALKLKYLGAGQFLRRNTSVYYVFFLWPFLLMAGPALYQMLRDRDMRIILISLGLLALNLLAQIWPPHSHYAAPAAGAIILLLLYSLRHFRNTYPEYGIWASRAVVIVFATWLISPIAQRLADPYQSLPKKTEDIRLEIPMQVQGARVKSDLEARSRKQLVIIHNPWFQVPSQDWVYNDADIDSSHVIWARDMGYEENKKLIDHYPDRQVSYVDRGDPGARIVPYDSAGLEWSPVLSPDLLDLSSRNLDQSARQTPVPARLQNTSYSNLQKHIP